MGLVKRDLITKNLQNDIAYPYNQDGVVRMLGDVYRLRKEAFTGVDSMADAIALLVDLETAVNAPAVLTPRQKQIVSLYYIHDLTTTEIARILDNTHSPVVRSLESAHERIALHLSGEAPKQPGQIKTSGEMKNVPASVRIHLERIENGDVSPLDMMNDTAFRDLQTYLSETDHMFHANPAPEPAYAAKFADATENYRFALRAEYPYYTDKVEIDAETGTIKYAIPATSVMNLKQKRVSFTPEPDRKPTKTKRDQRRQNEVKGASDADYDEKSGCGVYVRYPHDSEIRKFGRGNNAFWTYKRGWNWGKKKTSDA